ncbi:lmo0937 family membrane protein [Aliibacillus thermotolerans]|uniref:Lmo0937 family membrane protein n=1 Tax=Aliibacillus thermotolerans TaxID=1834418 RepID=A0ABW0U7R4_9BACI|nr:lmo0937 family membrane protein [Aliibacillus thermotolerans]
MLTRLAIILFILWAIGFFFGIAGGLIHTLFIVAIVLVKND